jgi:hypothetical protein
MLLIVVRMKKYKKKEVEKFGGIKKRHYLCTRNSGSSAVR